jgi:S1-C subfamily serine protease
MTFEAKVLRVSKERDIALIDIGSISLLPLPINSEPPKVGGELYAIGSPFDEEFSGTLTRGIYSGDRMFEDLTWIQSDVSVNPGNSGGPLLDEKANVVGITTLGFGGAGSGLNLFVPIKDGLKFLSVDLK